jgi:RNA polymerase sigma-70 factor (ECF subfamily)
MSGNEIDKKKFLEAYDAHADALFRHAYFRLHDRGRAEELMQEAFLRSWEYCLAREIPENLRAFLYRVLNNAIVDDFRKKKSVSLDALQEDEGYEPIAEESTSDSFRSEHLTALLQTLEPKEREVVVFRFIDELDIPEIATITGERENTISVRIHRAMKKLNERVKKEEKYHGF